MPTTALPPYATLRSVRTFRRWLDERRGRAAEIARQIGLDRNHVSDAKRGLRRIPAGYRKRLERLTGGRVKADGWLTPREVERAERIRRLLR